jgi:hypothetical protein
MREAILLLAQYVFMAWCLAKHRDNFTFTLPTAIWKCSIVNYSKSVRVVFLPFLSSWHGISYVTLRMKAARSRDAAL